MHLQHPMLCQWVRMYTLQCLCWANESALLPMFCLQRTLTYPVLPPRWHYWHSHRPDQKCLSHRFGHVFLFSFLTTPQPCWVSTLTHLIHYFQIYSVFRIVGYGPSQDKWYWWSYQEDTTVSLLLYAIASTAMTPVTELTNLFRCLDEYIKTWPFHFFQTPFGHFKIWPLAALTSH